MTVIKKSSLSSALAGESEGNQIQMGEVSVVLPSSWTDRTIHTFVAPRVVDPRQSPHLRMRGGFRENLSINRERVSYGQTAKDYLHQQVEELKSRLFNYRFLYEEPVLLAGQTAHSIAYQFSLRGQNIDVCQLRIALSLSYDMLVFTGTSSAHVFENKRRIFLKIARSIQVPSSTFPPSTVL